MTESPPTRVPPRLGLVLAACCLGQFMVILDVSVVNVALPVIDDVLRFAPGSLQWVMIAYTIVFTGFLLLGGRLADLYGQRRVFLTGITVFTLASLVGGLAYDPATLITARGLQGLGAAVMAPATLTVLGTTFRDPTARAKAFGLWGAVAGGGGAVGVLAGGVITDLLSWRWILLVNVPIGVALFALTARAVTERRNDDDGRKLDVAGALSVTLGLIALVYGIVGTQHGGWGSVGVLVPLGLAAVLLAFFVVDQAKLAAQPLVPLAIFRNRSLSAANLVRLGSGVAMGSTFYFLTLLLQRGMGYTALQAGLAYLPLSIGIFAGARGIATSVPKYGPRPILVFGLALSAVGLGWLSLTDEHATFQGGVLGPTLLIGIGVGVVMTASTTAATANLPYQQAGLASGLLNTTRQLGDAVGLAILVTIAAAHTAGPSVAATVSGYRLAFLVAGLVMVATIGAALAVPAKAKPRAASPQAAPESAKA